MNKPNYILQVEKTENIVFSVMKIDFFLKENNKKIIDRFDLVFSESIFPSKGEISWVEQLYKTKQDFYLYLLFNEDKCDSYIYYNQKQLKELMFFTKQLFKEWK